MESQILAMASQAKDEAREARLLASEANSKIDSYVKVMTVQHGAMLEKIDAQRKDMQKMEDVVIRQSQETHGMIRSLYNRAWVVAGTLIMLLLAVNGSLVAWIAFKLSL